MENIDVIYYINLAHRTDRNTHILNELKKVITKEKRLYRIDAIYDEYGIIGCVKSHIATIMNFMESGLENCIILEDDFEFTESKEKINELLTLFFKNIKSYDVLMLSSNTFEETNVYPGLNKILNSQTTSGYCLHKNFAQKLLDNFIEGLAFLTKTKDRIYSLDIYWKKLQPNNNWYCLQPRIGKQISGYSDIDNKYRNYKC